jgi:hypothetical protein
MPNYVYYQGSKKDDPWKPVPVSVKDKTLKDSGAVFVTALAVNKLVDQIEPSEKDKLAYEGPFYLDWDSKDIGQAIEKVNVVLDKFEKMGMNLNAIAFYATGQKGFHAEVPQSMFLEGKLPKAGIVGLPMIYKEMVYELAVDTLDLKIYSSGKGRMWRIPNVKRPDNGFYKVAVSVQELREMTPERYAEIIKEPRISLPLEVAEFNVDLHLMFVNAKQKVEDRLKARGTRKRDPQEKLKARMPSIRLMMEGKGIKPGTGFHEIAMQVTIAAVTAGLKPEQMIEECAGLVATHSSDSWRYNTPEKRIAELLRLYDYMLDNPCYDFGIGAIKSLLNHGAPDLDNLPVTKDEVAAEIVKAEEQGPIKSAGEDGEIVPDEYADLAGGITLSKYGVYVSAEDGKKRICGVSFTNIHLLYSITSGALAAYEAEVLVNGKTMGRFSMELDTFSSLVAFNKWARQFGHALQGAENHVRGLMMRFVEEGKKRGKMLYIVNREGLDLINIPSHDNEKLREPFMVYASAAGVLLDPRVRDAKLEISFQGFPDPRGVFKTDLADAPALADWIEEPENKEALRETIAGMLQMQTPEAVSKMIGWYVASMYRMVFHKGYNKFPLLHINGPAGSGKTEMNLALASFFFYHQEPKMTSPVSTFFALTQQMSGSASVPLIIDEYKPTEMNPEYYNKLKLAFRDAYNCREVTKGGGTREQDDYRILSSTQLAAPIVFIAEAAEEEAAVAERIVLTTIVKPSSSLALRQLGHYNKLYRNRHHLAILGQYLMTQVIEESGVEKLREEFDPLFNEAKKKYLLNDEDLVGQLSAEELSNKQRSKERTVFNYTVVRFGLHKFREVVEAIYGEEFKELFDKVEGGVYGRMHDLQAATQPEWAKVLAQLSEMSWALDGDSPMALRMGKEYALGSMGGKEVIEVSLRSAYFRYRQYCNTHRSKILFSGDQAFLHAMRDCPAKVEVGPGKFLKLPNVHCFDVARLAEAGVPAFKASR